MAGLAGIACQYEPPLSPGYRVIYCTSRGVSATSASVTPMALFVQLQMIYIIFMP